MGAIAVLTGKLAGRAHAGAGRLPPGGGGPCGLPSPGVCSACDPSARDAAGRAGDGRVSAIEANRERLASLGTMAAGLAHELNNPAAAARRAAAQMTEALEAIGATLGRIRGGGDRARGRGAARGAAARGGSAGRRRPARWRRSTPRTPRRRCSPAWRRWRWRSPGAWPSRWRRPASISSGLIAWRRWPARRRAPRCAGLLRR